ncbi:MAG: magnesium chelatase subunit H [Pseudomonadota bacterium]
MKRNPISAADKRRAPVPVNVVMITLDNHMSSAVDEARSALRPDLPGLNLSVHAATDWADNPARLKACKDDIAKGDIIVASMLFVEEHVKAVLPDLEARRDDCDAMVCCMSAGDVMKNTAMGDFRMDGKQSGPIALLKKLRGSSEKGNASPKTAGERQMRMLRRLPKILRFIPGTAQDVRAYFLALQYRLAASQDNIANMVRMLVDRYATGDRKALRNQLTYEDPVEYAETGVYHPSLKSKVSTSVADLPKAKNAKATVGLLLLRSYLLSGDTAHYDAVISAFEARGVNVVPVFASGLDMRPAIETFLSGGKTGVTVDTLVSLTGFSLVGGPAFSDTAAAAEALETLDVPYLSAYISEFQSLEQWEASDTGLTPIETTLMVAIPELDGATGSVLYGGRSQNATNRKMLPNAERIDSLVGRAEKLALLRKTERAERKIAVTLFNFPPNAGNLGTAAFLSVFESLHATLTRLKAEGYTIEDLPADSEALRQEVLTGNAEMHGALANVHTLIPTDDHVRREPHLADIEAQWGAAPGRDLTNGSSIFVLGKQYGNVLVAVQPGFGYEGDPMRLLFEKGFAPTHAFSAFYRYLREDFAADAVLHFGTHGALEFMPGKQVGLSGDCWPERLIGDLPNMYLYAANNPSEGTIAKRRSSATLVSYLTPPVTQAGLYKGLADLKDSLDQWRTLTPNDAAERASIFELILAQAKQLDLADALSPDDEDGTIEHLLAAMHELEDALIPQGLHVAGKPMDAAARLDMLQLIAEADDTPTPSRDVLEKIASGQTVIVPDEDEKDALIRQLVSVNAHLSENKELDGIVTALDGRFVQPSPSGDLIRTPDMLPTGRNIHGFDPFSIPSKFAVVDGARQAALVLARHLETSQALPETIALVLWGTDNLKSAGGPIGQALALLGARPRLDSYNRVCGAELIPLEEVGRPRIDVVMTLSGIFRDLLPMQASMLAEASYLAATADEPEAQNYVRKHALAYAEAQGCSLEDAALRVFSNGEGAYGANVNYLIGASAWTDDQEIGDTYTNRKGFAINRKGKTTKQTDLLKDVLGQVDMAYQSLDSVELGVTTIDHYFDTLGGISKSASLAKGGEDIPVYISDQTQGEGKVRTLGEQVSLETRTRSLNPKWFEGMLDHGYEGVRQIEAQVSNTMGWSATTGQVQPWVYQELSETFILDDAMRKRLADLNPASSARMVGRLIEASERNYWQPDAETLEALQAANDDLEDRLEGVEAS